MNEAETRAEYIDPKLKQSGWGEVDGSKILREYQINEGRIHIGGVRGKKDIADYVLVYKNQKLAVIEAKSDELTPTEGVNQAKDYAKKLELTYTYSTNGKEIYEINLKTGKEWSPQCFPSPDELWQAIYSDQNEWEEKFNQIPFESVYGTMDLRYYQEIAVNHAMEAIAKNKQRVG